MHMDLSSFAKLFDHSIVRPNATRPEVVQFGETAARLGAATLTVQPHYIPLAAELLRGTDVLVGTVVGFPHGNETPAMKRYQAEQVLALGAQEIDMVMNIPALKNSEQQVFMRDIEGVVSAAAGKVVKVITADFVKTSTAYADGGATLADVRLMHEVVNGRCQVKAAGGIRELPELLEYLRAGARRFGSTRTDQFVRAFAALPAEQKRSFAEYVPSLVASR